MSVRTDGKAAYTCISDFECAKRGKQIVDLQRELAAAQAEIAALREDKEIARRIRGIHASDCATHNEPAMPKAGCDCGTVEKVKVSCGCYPTGCVCGKLDEAASDGFDHGWNAAIDAARKEQP